MKRHLKLWAVFTFNIIACSLAVFVLTAALLYIVMHSRFAYLLSTPNGLMPLITSVLVALVSATSLFSVVSRKFFKPIERLIQALKEVSAGNFQVRLEETGEESEITAMNRNFNTMVRELNSIEMLQSDFIQNVSHEFKTPLASIEGYATLIHASDLPDELHEYTARILESTRQLSTLTGNILQLCKLENQQIVTEKQTFSLDEQLRQAILCLEPLWSQKELDIDFNLPEVFFHGSETLLFQVWTNLLSNAIKFTPKGGTIAADLSADEAGVTVTIRDTGIGMTDEVCRHVFDKFYQGERGRSREGNGLGLALVKKVVELCGGTIRVKSKPGEGSTFTVWLPVERL